MKRSTIAVRVNLLSSNHEELMELAIRRGFIWPSFEMYGGVRGFYDFGPLGTPLKNKIIQKWREFFVLGEGSLEIDSPTIMPEEVFKASGHLEHFVDLMTECEKCGQAFKVTELVKEKTGMDVEGSPKLELEKIIRQHEIACPECGGKLGSVFEFNTMFRTVIGPGGKRVGYLRPETAQGIFVDFKRLWRQAREMLPFGVAQIGRGYRNEISPRQGMIRLREFTMAELEVFFDPEGPSHPRFSVLGEDTLKLWRAGREKIVDMEVREAVEKGVVCNELMGYYMGLTKRFLIELGIPEENIRFREQTERQRAHYSKETWDAEVRTERFGWIEVAGIAYRTDYDLSRHSKFSKEDLTVFLQSENRRITCHVLEPSFGIDRIFYCVLEHSYKHDGKRKYLSLKRELAPIDVCVFPLMNRDGLPEKAITVHELLRKRKFSVVYDASGSIGRRYARADEIGIPYCITIDHQTLEDHSVTIRDRDTTKQVRSSIEDLPSTLRSLLNGELEFESAGTPLTK